MDMVAGSRLESIDVAFHPNHCFHSMAMTMAVSSSTNCLVGSIVAEDVAEVARSIGMAGVDAAVAFGAAAVDCVLYHYHQDRTCGGPIHQMNMSPLIVANIVHLQFLS